MNICLCPPLRPCQLIYPVSAGVYSLPVIAVGYFLGGFLMKKYKVSTFLAAKIGFFTSITEYLIYFLAFAMLCKNATVAGLTVTYDG